MSSCIREEGGVRASRRHVFMNPCLQAGRGLLARDNVMYSCLHVFGWIPVFFLIFVLVIVFGFTLPLFPLVFLDVLCFSYGVP